jgi:hypothetical protein
VGALFSIENNPLEKENAKAAIPKTLGTPDYPDYSAMPKP